MSAERPPIMQLLDSRGFVSPEKLAEKYGLNEADWVTVADGTMEEVFGAKPEAQQ